MLDKVNTLPINELRAKIRSKESIICWNCDEHRATDVHHQDGDHSNGEPSNLVPWCKRCHNEHHGISDNLTTLGLIVQSYEDVQRMRIAISNRLDAYKRLHYEVARLYPLKDALMAQEESLKDSMEQAVKLAPIYNAWLAHVMGISTTISGKLIHHIGSVDKFPTVSSLWAYAGLQVIDGKAPKKRKGESAPWNHALKVVAVGLVPDSFIRLGKECKDLGRVLYDRYKDFYTQRDGDELSCLHIERRARRKLGKVFLSCLWTTWRELEGLPVTEPYASKLDGHTHIVRPWDWILGGKRTYDLRLELARQEQLALMI